MKVIILCGGSGLRMKEITQNIPKPMALVDSKPILWHIMKLFYSYGFRDFILLLGYKGEIIKEYFMNYNWRSKSFVLDNTTEQPIITMLEQSEKWKITFLDTGDDTMTGGRIKQAEPFIDEDGCFLTYGDGICDINIAELLNFHKKMGKLSTITGVKKETQFGFINSENNIAIDFREKPMLDKMINGGFFVLDKEAFKFIDKDKNCCFEKEPLQKLAAERQLSVYKHEGYWSAVDTIKDLEAVNEYFHTNKPIWYSNKI